MAILINDNYSLSACKPFDARYLNICTPWTDVPEVLAAIPTYRYIGLTVNIAGVEYWWKDGVGDGDLVIKTAGAGTGTLTGATNGLFVINSGTTVMLGGNLTTGTTFNGMGLYPVTFQNISDFQITPSGSSSVIFGIDSAGLLFTFTGGTVSFDDNGGLKYGGNYSANYDNRSLVDKEYVDLAISAATSGITGTITGATNGLSVAGADVKLGGTLCEMTTICGNNQILCLGTTSSCLNLFDVESSQSQIQGDSIYLNGGTCTEINGGSIRLCLTNSCGLITDNRASGLKYGLEYAADYSADFQPNSLITKFYADSIASGLDPKLAVCVATTGNIVLSGTPSIDGLTVVDGWRILVKNQISGDTNGIYIVNSGGTWSRSSDFDFNPPSGEVVQGALVPVITGNTQRNTIWVLTTPDPITTGETLTFGLFSSPLVTAGHGIAISGMTISVDGAALDGNSILWSGGTFNVDVNSGTLQTALASKVNVSTFTGYSATTKIDIDSKLPISTFSGYTGTTLTLINSKLDTTIFTGYTATTQPILDNAITGVTSVGGGESIYSGKTGRDAVLFTIVGSGGTTVQTIGNEIIIHSLSGGTGDDIIYNGQSPAAIDVGGIDSGYILTGKTITCILQDLFVPELFQTSVGTPTTTVGGVSGTYEVGCQLSLTITPNYSAGAITPLYCTSAPYTRGGAANNYSYSGPSVSTGFLGCTSCVLNPYTVVSGTQTWSVCTRYDQGACIRGSKNTVNPSYPTVCPASGCTSAGSASLSGIYPYYYGKLSSGSRPAVTNSLVTGGTKTVASSTSTVTVTFGSGGEWTWLAIPQTSTSKTCWYVTALDNGRINNAPTDKYPDECIISITSGQGCWSSINYKVYMSGYAASDANPIQFRNS